MAQVSVPLKHDLILKAGRHHVHTLALEGALFLAPIKDDIQARCSDSRSSNGKVGFSLTFTTENARHWNWDGNLGNVCSMTTQKLYVTNAYNY